MLRRLGAAQRGDHRLFVVDDVSCDTRLEVRIEVRIEVRFDIRNDVPFAHV